MDSFENTLRTAANLQEAKRQELKATKYTPGPWEASDYLAQAELIQWLLGLHALQIGDGSTRGDCGYILPLNERVANARLIAAAPELLAACRKALTCGLDSGVREVICAAIAKAEGR